MLPNANEIKSFKFFKRNPDINANTNTNTDTSFKATKAAQVCIPATCSDLTIEAEIFLWNLSLIDNMKKKVDGLLAISNFNNRIEHTTKDLGVLTQGCGKLQVGNYWFVCVYTVYCMCVFVVLVVLY